MGGSFVARTRGRMPRTVTNDPSACHQNPRVKPKSARSAVALWGEKKGEILSSLSERNRELPESFAECPFLLNSESDITGALARRLFGDAAIDPVIAVESESMGTMLKLCVDGAGAYFCPESLAEKLLPRSAQKKLHRITFEDGKYEISFGYQKSAERWSMIGRFIEEAFKSRGKKFPLAKP